jgi:sugar (pentulose or hexulose) kinase
MAGELGITLEEIVISGGGASSPLFVQTFADVFGLPATRSSGAAGASLGAAICAASAAGIYPDIETAAARMTSEREAFAPDPGNTAIYERMNETVYQAIRAATDPLLERSFPIFH